eukprot:10160573-Alexandrium_andersonii.AAC.1
MHTRRQHARKRASIHAPVPSAAPQTHACCNAARRPFLGARPLHALRITNAFPIQSSFSPR